jgi:hemolysin D
MNQTVPPPKPERPEPQAAKTAQQKQLQLTDVQGTDREFLPAALEILETPPSPKPVAFMLTLCAFVALTLLWSFIGKLDVHAVAWGKIEVTGRAKVIQPLDPGKVAAIHAENGTTVKAGDVLIELDPAEAQADATAAEEALAASLAEVARRRVAIETAGPLQRTTYRVGGKNMPTLPAIPPPIPFSNIPAPIQAREKAVLAADLVQLHDTLANLDKQMAQKLATRKRLEGSIAYQNSLIKTLEGRVDMRESAIKLDVGTKVNLFDAKESLQKSQAQLASDNGQLIETDAALEEIDSQKVKAVSQFMAENETRLAEASRKADETAQQLAKARVKLARTKLVAPIDGTVQQVAVTTIGQVVTTGQQLMTLIPKKGALQVEAYVSNIDIGFVKAGQNVEIKIDAFPFTRFGTIQGKVLKVATDAIDEQDAKRALSNAIASANGANAPSNTAPGQTQNFVFPVTISLDATAMNIDGATVPLTPGMTVSAEIKTDSRRVIDYLVSPIAKIKSEAMKER